MLRLLWVTSLLLITGLGVWLASSLVAYAGGPAALACVGGVVLFPVLPLWWEKRATDAFYAKLKRSTRLLPKKRALTASTRLALRTVAINTVFVAMLLVLWPQIAFAALATRGDWFLRDAKGPWVERTRTVVVNAASGLEWLHNATRKNPYRTPEDAKVPVPDDVKPTVAVVTPYGEGRRWRRPDPAPLPVPAPVDPVQPEPGPVPVPVPTVREVPPLPKEAPVYTVGSTSWPWAATVHPVVQAMTPYEESTLEGVARYISSHTSDPFERVKALHDWVVTRLKYDSASVTGPRKPQDAQAVFDSRLGVCEGYARLLVEFGRITGDKIMYVTGEVREPHGELAPVGHAWNAVEINGSWYLMDATWDDPVMSDGSDAYGTDYLFIPPELAGLNHFPDEPRWQLRETPLSRAEFLRQPLATPGLAREHLVLKSPTGLVVSVSDTFALELENPARAYVMVMIGQQRCGPSNEAALSLSCPVATGVHEAVVLVNGSRVGRYEGIASFRLQ